MDWSAEGPRQTPLPILVGPVRSHCGTPVLIPGLPQWQAMKTSTWRPWSKTGPSWKQPQAVGLKVASLSLGPRGCAVPRQASSWPNMRTNRPGHLHFDLFTHWLHLAQTSLRSD